MLLQHSMKNATHLQATAGQREGGVTTSCAPSRAADAESRTTRDGFQARRWQPCCSKGCTNAKLIIPTPMPRLQHQHRQTSHLRCTDNSCRTPTHPPIGVNPSLHTLQSTTRWMGLHQDTLLAAERYLFINAASTQEDGRDPMIGWRTLFASFTTH